LPPIKRLEKCSRLPRKADPGRLHQKKSKGKTQIQYSGLCGPVDELRLRMREVNTLRVAVTKEAKRRNADGIDTGPLTFFDLFLQKRYKQLKVEKERLMHDANAKITWRLLPGGSTKWLD
jgi:hypothetical protein